jgi:DNA-binding GntR family transcriptional regulator
MTNDSITSLSDTIYRRVTDNLRMLIVTGEFEPGQRLKMSDLIRKFGTSQMPIREALQQLQGEGLITIAPHRGAQVRSVDRRFISNIYDLRFAIESFLIRKTCQKKSLNWIKELKKAQEAYDSLIENDNIPGLIEANHRFHRVHNAVAGNEEALETIERTNTLLTVLRTTYGYQKERILKISAEHLQMIKCFEKRDVSGILAVHAKHCENAKSNLLQVVPKLPKKESIRIS